MASGFACRDAPLCIFVLTCLGQVYSCVLQAAAKRDETIAATLSHSQVSEFPDEVTLKMMPLSYSSSKGGNGPSQSQLLQGGAAIGLGAYGAWHYLGGGDSGDGQSQPQQPQQEITIDMSQGMGQLQQSLVAAGTTLINQNTATNLKHQQALDQQQLATQRQIAREKAATQAAEDQRRHKAQLEADKEATRQRSLAELNRLREEAQMRLKSEQELAMQRARDARELEQEKARNTVNTAREAATVELQLREEAAVRKEERQQQAHKEREDLRRVTEMELMGRKEKIDVKAATAAARVRAETEAEVHRWLLCRLSPIVGASVATYSFLPSCITQPITVTTLLCLSVFLTRHRPLLFVCLLSPSFAFM